MIFVDTVMKRLSEAIKTAPPAEVALHSLIAFIALFGLFQFVGGGLFGLLPRRQLQCAHRWRTQRHESHAGKG